MGSEYESGAVRLSECEPKDWFVVFTEESDKWWIRWLARGRFKHVSCFGYVERAYSWVFYDFYLDRARISVVNDHEANALIGHYSSSGTVVRMARPIGREAEVNLRSGWWCVPAVAHIIGLKSCALRPDALFRQCLANGGEIIGERHESENARRPGTEAAAGSRGAGEGHDDSAASFV